MQLNTIEGAFAVAADNLSAPYLTLFALAFGATPSQIGMLAAFPNFLGNILQIPAGLLAERTKDKRLLPTIGGYLSRLTWLALALLPFLFAPERRVALIIVLATFRIIMANLGVPAWTALQATLVPRSIRGKYYANRNVVLNFCALLATFGAVYFLRLDFPVNYQILFGAAAILGVTSTTLFSLIRFDQPPPKQRKAVQEGILVRARSFWIALYREKDFVCYSLSSFVFNFGVFSASSLFAVHFVDTMGGKAGSWAIFTATSLASTIVMQRYWGRLADLFGQKSVMTLSGLGVIAIPLLWFIAPTTWFPILIHVINGLAWGGYNLAAFNLLLEITPDENRSLFVGVYNTLMGIATSLGPFTGGFAAELWGLRPIFLASAVLRAGGLFIFWRTVSNPSDRSPTMRDLLPILPISRKTRPGS